MLRPAAFFLACIAGYGSLIAWLAATVDVPVERVWYSIGHYAVAATLSTALFWLLRSRRLSLIGNPGAGFILMTLMYYTLSGVKYFEPFPYYIMFDLDYQERFISSMWGGLVIGLGIGVLALFKGATVSKVNELFERHFPNFARVFFALLFINVLLKVYLYAIGFGSAYTEGAITASDTRNPIQLLAIFGELYLSFTLVVIAVVIALLKPEQLKVSPHLRTIALLVALTLPLYTVALLKGRLVALLYLFLILFALQVRSQKWSLGGFQALLCLTPILAVASVYTATRALGRDFREFGIEPSMSFNAGLIGWRSDITDYGYAVSKRADWKAVEPGVITHGLLNAVPSVFWPRKDQQLDNTHYLAIHSLGWPSGLFGSRVVDYGDNLMSMGAFAFGWPGYFLVFPAYIALLSGIARALFRYAKAFAGLVPFIFIGVIGIRTEFDWTSATLYMRDFILYSALLIALATPALRIRLFGLIRRRPVEAATG